MDSLCGLSPLSHPPSTINNINNPNPGVLQLQSHCFGQAQGSSGSNGWNFSSRNCLICNVPFIGRENNEGGGQEGHDLGDEDLRQGFHLFYKLFELEGDLGVDFLSNPSRPKESSTRESDPSIAFGSNSYCISCSFKVGNLVQLWKQAEEIQRLIHGVRREVLQILQRTFPQVPSGTTIHLLKAKVLEKSDLRNYGEPIDLPPVSTTGTGNDNLNLSHVALSQSQCQVYRAAQWENSGFSSSPSSRITYPPVFSTVDQVEVQVERHQESESNIEGNLEESPAPASPNESSYSSNGGDTNEVIEKPVGSSSVLPDDHPSSKHEVMQLRRSQRTRTPKRYWEREEPAIEITSGNEGAEERATRTQTGSKRRRGLPESESNSTITPNEVVEHEIMRGEVNEPNSANENTSEQSSESAPNRVDGERETLGSTRRKKPKGPVVHECHICLKVVKSALSLKNHHRVHTGEKPFKCSFCDRTFAEKCNMKKHENSVHQRSKFYKCKICDYTAHSSAIINSHTKYKHKGFKLIKRDVQCEICGMYLKGNQVLRRHMISHEGVVKPCKICGKPIRGINASMERHLKTHNPRNLERDFAYKCNQCTMTFPSKKSLGKHMYNEHDADTQCTREIPVVDRLKKRFDCPECPGLFYRTPKALKDHIGAGHKAGNHRRRRTMSDSQDTEPNVGTDEGGPSKKHEQEESFKKEYPCPEDKCPRTFHLLLNMQRHLVNYHPNSDIDTIRHNRKKIRLTYRCDECASCPPFPCYSDRIKHYELIHSEGSSAFHPFKCPEKNCFKEFVFVWALRTHMQSAHPKFKLETFVLDGESIPIRYTCKQCPNSVETVFHGAAGLRRHMEKVHSSTPLPELHCPACALPFKLSSELQRHFTEVHKTKDDNHIIESGEGQIPLRIVCENCPTGQGFPTMKKLHEHMLLAKHKVPLRGVPRPSVKCPDCDVSLRLGGLVYHFLHNHPGSRNDVVQIEWLRFSLFNRCLECDGDPFENKALLDVHLRDFHYVGPGFKCSKCPDPKPTFRSRNKLEVHKADVHRGPKLNLNSSTVREMKCLACGPSEPEYNQWSKFIEHYKCAHAGEEPPHDLYITCPDVKSCDHPAFESKELLSSHQASAHSANLDYSKLKCPEPRCKVTRKTIRALREHFLSWHPSSEINDATVRDKDGKTFKLFYPCLICSQRFLSNKKLTIHLQMKHKNERQSVPRDLIQKTLFSNTNLTCPDAETCGTAESEFKSLIALRAHFISKHPLSKNNKIILNNKEITLAFVCDQCPNLTWCTTDSGLKRHITLSHIKTEQLSESSKPDKDQSNCESESESSKSESSESDNNESSGSESQHESIDLGDDGETDSSNNANPSKSKSISTTTDTNAPPTVRTWTLRGNRITNYSKFLEGPEDEDDDIEIESTTLTSELPPSKSTPLKPSNPISTSTSPESSYSPIEGHPPAQEILEVHDDIIPENLTEEVEIDIKYEADVRTDKNVGIDERSQNTTTQPVPIIFEKVIKTENEDRSIGPVVDNGDLEEWMVDRNQRKVSMNRKLRPRPGPKSKSKFRNKDKRTITMKDKKLKQKVHVPNVKESKTNPNTHDPKRICPSSSIQTPNSSDGDLTKVFDSNKTVSVRLDRFDQVKVKKQATISLAPLTENIGLKLPIIRLVRVDLPPKLPTKSKDLRRISERK